MISTYSFYITIIIIIIIIIIMIITIISLSLSLSLLFGLSSSPLTSLPLSQAWPATLHW